ncbi:head-tail connector protein [Clostridium sp.]|jgi:uncharacterized phage protein (predicted DNA packaging)|uniref:head-tail connector protein n=1 Tax=Clostridium sp. TaxID=1506 RepID=UPI002FDEE5D4
MSILNLGEAKKYLRVDYEDEDEDIQSLLDAAEKYLINAGCILNENDEIAKLAIKMLINEWYENRGPVLIGSISKKLEYGLQALIAQLKYCDLDTSY